MRFGALTFAAISALALLVPSACGSQGTVAPTADDGGPTTPDADADGGAIGAEGGTTVTPDAAPAVDAAPPEIPCTGKVGKTGDFHLNLPSGDRTRLYDIHVPASYIPTKHAPFVLLFHGYTQTAAEIATATHFSAAADARGMIVVYPNGTGISQGFNAGDCCGTAVTDLVDDVVFTKDVIAAVNSQYCVDSKRVFSTGFSNGAFFSYRLGCELSDQIAAIAPVSGGIHVDLATCKPKRAVPVLHIHGTNDVLVPYNGGGAGLDHPVTDSIDVFRTNNACAAGAGKVVYTMGDVSCTKWDGCTNKADVELCTVTGGGHQWPGGDLFPLYGGTKSDNIVASEAIADFFLAHPMP